MPQKGVHLIRHAIYRTLELGGQFLLLGSSPVPHIQVNLVFLQSSLAVMMLYESTMQLLPLLGLYLYFCDSPCTISLPSDYIALYYTVVSMPFFFWGGTL